MPWCPKCKLEYVEGIKVCPDCKTALVDSLDDINSEEEFDFSEDYEIPEEEMAKALTPYFPELSEEERADMMENLKKGAMIPKYKSKDEAYNEHKSGAFSLIIVGIIGLAVIVLNALHILSLPLSGFSSTLTNVVMGVLFFIFLGSGLLSFFKATKLKPLATSEKELINTVVNFVKDKKAAGDYKIDKNCDNYEEEFIKLNDKVVADIEANFPDLEPGFSYYVVDRFVTDILDED